MGPHLPPRLIMRVQDTSLLFLISLPLLVALLGCRSSRHLDADSVDAHTVQREGWGTTEAGEAVELYTLRSPAGITARIATYGATLTELWVPSREGERADVVLGFDDVAGYESSVDQYFGCTVGRVANRVAKARFQLDDRTYDVTANDGANQLHGGAPGWGDKVWSAAVTEEGERAAVRFTILSEDGDQGYPNAVTAHVTYSLDSRSLTVEYEATSDGPTPINLTHHSYFNLAGHGTGSMLDHELMIAASRYTPVDETLIPTGEIVSVLGTPLDFTEFQRIGRGVHHHDDAPTIGYDHNFVLDEGGASGGVVEPFFAASLRHPRSGRSLEIWTTEPGLQLYSGNFLFGQGGKRGAIYLHRGALCLETQNFPDAINQLAFPSPVLRSGETYRHVTEHRFDW